MPEPLKIDNVNHPSHYGGDTTYEVIKVINAWGLGFDLVRGSCSSKESKDECNP